MAVKTGVLFLAFLVSTLAIPTPEQADRDSLFVHVDPTARIVGGTPAAEGSVPYMAALTDGRLIRTLFCGGSIIGSRTILTAAHCIEAAYLGGSTQSLRRAVYATVGTNRWRNGGQSYHLTRNVTHPNYVSRTIKNDIGLLYSTEDIVFSPTVMPITIAYDFVPAGVVARAAGWGRTRTGGSINAVLLELSPTTVDGEFCATQVATVAQSLNMRPPPVESHIEICTFHSPGTGMCTGDSGSALVRRDRNQQIGIVSWGIPCARGAPDMFVRLSAYQEFIQTNTI